MRKAPFSIRSGKEKKGVFGPQSLSKRGGGGDLLDKKKRDRRSVLQKTPHLKGKN